MRRWLGGALLAGVVAVVGWGLFARGSERRGTAYSVGRRLARESSVTLRSVTQDNVATEGKTNAAAAGSPACNDVRLYDVEVDEANRVRGAWLGAEQGEPTMVELGGVMGSGTLVSASLGSNGEAEAWLRMPSGLCRVAFAAGQTIQPFLPQPSGPNGDTNGSSPPARAGAGSPSSATSMILEAPDLRAVVTYKMGPPPDASASPAEKATAGGPRALPNPPAVGRPFGWRLPVAEETDAGSPIPNGDRR
jgi:hypothetical protein